MKFVFDAVVLSVRARQSKDGKSTYYDVNLDQDGEIVTMGCTEAVAQLVGPNKYTPYRLVGEYTKAEYGNTVYTRIGVVDAKVAK